MTLRHPVSFGSKYFDPVQIVFTLSVLDSTTHMLALTQLFRMLSNQSCREELFRAKNKDTVLRIIQKYTIQYKEEQSAF